MKKIKIVILLIGFISLLFLLSSNFSLSNNSFLWIKNPIDKNSIIYSNYVLWEDNGSAICNYAGDQRYPQLCSDGNGGAIITWEDWRSGGNIYAQKINSSGHVQWTGNGTPICTAFNSQMEPCICSDGEGGAIITWRDYRNPSIDIYAQKVNSSGHTQWTNDGVAICTETNTQWLPAICNDGNGGAIITWQDYRNQTVTAYDIYVQRIDSNGNVNWTSNGIPICTEIDDQQFPKIISDQNGGAIISWADYRDSGADIYAQRVNSSGHIQWTNNGTSICTAIWDQYSPRMCNDENGGAIITWLDYRMGTHYNVYAQRINLTGDIQWTIDGAGVCTASDHQEFPRICSDGVGGAIISWEDRVTSIVDIYVQRINSTGDIQWPSRGVPICTENNQQKYPEICDDGIEGAIIAWRDNRSGNFDIYAQRINSTGHTQWTDNGTIICNAINEQDWHEIISDGSGGAIITWQDARDGAIDEHIYAQKTIGQVNQPPTSDQPDDINTTAGGTETINWTLYDDLGPGKYRVWANDTNGNFYVWVDWDFWTNGTSLDIEINRTAPGIYNYTIEYYDIFNAFGIPKTVHVNIIDISSPNIISILQDPPSPDCLESVNITVRITDDFIISDVIIEHNFTGQPLDNYSMQFLNGDRNKDGWWNYIIANGSAGDTISYRILCNDSLNLWNNTIYFNYTITDAIPPFIQLPVLQDPPTPNCLDLVNITVRIIDNFNISDVIIEHNLTKSFVNYSMQFLSGIRDTDSWWNHTIANGSAGDTISYRILCNDSVDLCDSTIYFNYTITDAIPPIIQLPVLQDPSIPNCLDIVNITVRIIDNFNISDVIIEHNLTKSFVNYSMRFLSGIRDTNGSWNYTIAAGSAGSTIAYRILCNDSLNLWDSTIYYYYKVKGNNGLKQHLNPGINYISLYDDDGFLWINLTIDVNTETNITLTVNLSRPPTFEYKKDGIIYYDINLENPLVLNSVIIHFYYNESLLNGISEQNLVIYVYDGTSGSWKALNGTINEALNYIEVSLNELSQFVLAPKITKDAPFLFLPPSAADNIILIIIGLIGSIAALGLISYKLKTRKKIKEVEIHPKKGKVKGLTKEELVSPKVKAEPIPKEEKIIIKRAYDYVGGNIRFKVVVENKSDEIVRDIAILLNVKKQFWIKSSLNKIDILDPNESRGVDFNLIPTTCGKSTIHGTISYLDARGQPFSTVLKPSIVQIKCPLVKPKPLKLIDFIKLKEQLQKSHAEIEYSDISTSKAFQIAREQISSLDVLEIDKSEEKFNVLYSAEAKIGGNLIIIDLNVNPNFIIIDVYLSDIKQATGFLAYIKNLINLTLQYSKQISTSLDKLTDKIYNAFEFGLRLLELFNLCENKESKDDILLILKELKIKSNSYFPDLKITESFDNWLNDLEKIEDQTLWDRIYLNLQFDIMNWMKLIIIVSDTNSKNYFESLSVEDETRKNIESGNLRLKEELEIKTKQYSNKILFNLMLINSKSGISMYNYNFSEEILDPDLIGGFLTAIRSFGEEVSKKEAAMKKLSYEYFEIELVEGEFTRAALITMGFPDELTIKKLNKFLNKFESKYRVELELFAGNVLVFEGAKDLVQEIFLKQNSKY